MKLVKENQLGVNSACIRNKGVTIHLAHKTRRYIDNIYWAHKNETGLQGLRGPGAGYTSETNLKLFYLYVHSYYLFVLFTQSLSL